jgi:hypothetical protein
MKYMTAELLARYQSEDESAALQAFEQWEQAGESYRTELQALRQKLPQPAADLIDRFQLHDARVLFVGVHPAAVVFVLMLDGEGGGLQLEYDLTKPATLTLHPEIAEDCPLEWVYDELSATDGHFIHCILFSDGSELRLAFRSLRLLYFPKSMFVGVPGPTTQAAHNLAELVAA